MGSSFQKIELRQGNVRGRPADGHPNQQNDDNPAQHSPTALATNVRHSPNQYNKCCNNLQAIFCCHVLAMLSR